VTSRQTPLQRHPIFRERGNIGEKKGGGPNKRTSHLELRHPTLASFFPAGKLEVL